MVFQWVPRLVNGGAHQLPKRLSQSPRHFFFWLVLDIASAKLVWCGSEHVQELIH